MQLHDHRHSATKGDPVRPALSFLHNHRVEPVGGMGGVDGIGNIVADGLGHDVGLSPEPRGDLSVKRPRTPPESDHGRVVQPRRIFGKRDDHRTVSGGPKPLSKLIDRRGDTVRRFDPGHAGVRRPMVSLRSMPRLERGVDRLPSQVPCRRRRRQAGVPRATRPASRAAPHRSRERRPRAAGRAR